MWFLLLVAISCHLHIAHARNIDSKNYQTKFAVDVSPNKIRSASANLDDITCTMYYKTEGYKAEEWEFNLRLDEDVSLTVIVKNPLGVSLLKFRSMKVLCDGRPGYDRQNLWYYNTYEAFGDGQIDLRKDAFRSVQTALALDEAAFVTSRAMYRLELEYDIPDVNRTVMHPPERSNSKETVPLKMHDVGVESVDGPFKGNVATLRLYFESETANFVRQQMYGLPTDLDHDEL